MLSFQPKVSIIIPVYNGANYLRKAIESALAQTYPNLEIIVVNDGSSDHGATDEIARSYGSKIRYVVKENGGVASALNMGIENMTGEYFSWLSHDDMYYPNKIEKQISALAEIGNPNAVCACNVTVIDEHDQVIKADRIDSRASRSIRCFMALDTATGLNGCSLLVPRALFLQWGCFNTALKATQDYDLWFKFADHAQFHIIEDALVMSRVHEKQGGRTMGNLPTIEADKLHALMLSKIETAELRKFLGEDIEYLLNAYSVYQNARYYKTAARLYAATINFALDLGDHHRAAQLFNQRLFPVDSPHESETLATLITITTEPLSEIKPLILIYCNVWTKGGTERVMSTLFDTLSQKYRFILVSHPTQANLEGFSISNEVCHIQIRPELLSEIPYVLLMLAALTRASLVISNPNIFLDVLKIYPVMKDSGIKTIACNHNYYFLPTWASWLYPVMAERLSYLNDATVTTWLTSFSANAYALHNNNGATMPNPNTFTRDDVHLNQTSGEIVLCVGRFYDSIKRLDRALEVFKQVLALRPSARLVLVGGYNLDLNISATSPETLGALFKRLDFPEGAVIFHGEQDFVAPYYEEASVLIMPSDNEGFSLVLIEAGLHGVPSVIFEIPGLEDIITDGTNGYIVPQGDITGMATKVAALLSDPTLRQTMAQNAKEMAARFDREIISRRWSELIDLTLSKGDDEAFYPRLKECFMTAPKDAQSFAKTLAHEYEAGVKKVIQEAYLKEKIPNVVEKVVERVIEYHYTNDPVTSPVTPEFTEKEYRVLSVLRRIRNNHIFHFVYADVTKPILRAVRDGLRRVLTPFNHQIIKK